MLIKCYNTCVWGNCLIRKCVKRVYLTVSECHERLSLQVGLFPLWIAVHKLIVSAKCLFTSRAASHYLKQSLLSVRSAQDELKPKKKRFLNVKKI